MQREQGNPTAAGAESSDASMEVYVDGVRVIEVTAGTDWHCYLCWRRCDVMVQAEVTPSAALGNTVPTTMWLCRGCAKWWQGRPGEVR